MTWGEAIFSVSQWSFAIRDFLVSYPCLDIGFKMKIIRSLLFILLVSCGAGVDEVGHNGVCEGYEAAEDSPYVLPYPPGTAVKISYMNQ